MHYQNSQVCVPRVSKYKESIIELTVIETNVDNSDSDESEIVSPFYEIENTLNQVPQHDLPDDQNLQSSSQTVPFRLRDFAELVPPSERILEGGTSSQDVAAIRPPHYSEESEYDETEGRSICCGGVAMEPLEVLPLEATGRNTQLFKFCK